jgi:transposase
VATKPVNVRKGQDGLAALIKNELRKDVFAGTVLWSGQGGQTD